jgi:uncharacterized protein YecE (DUF72 family)
LPAVTNRTEPLLRLFLFDSQEWCPSLVVADAQMHKKNADDREASKAPMNQAAAENVRETAFIGTSGWAYASWKPGFYPQALAQKKFLEYYATQLNSVGVNYTFRQMPTENMLAGWLAATGAGFRFSFKAPQRITHILRLKDCADAVFALSRGLAPVAAAGRMGVVLFQLPPNFKADPTRLDAFLADAKTRGLRMAFEFRQSTWFCDEVYTVLQRHGAALCVAESEDLEAPDVVTAPFTCYRLRKSGYSAADLDVLADTLRKRSSEGNVFAYFKHEEQPTGAVSAVDTLRRLRQQ